MKKTNKPSPVQCTKHQGIIFILTPPSFTKISLLDFLLFRFPFLCFPTFFSLASISLLWADFSHAKHSRVFQFERTFFPDICFVPIYVCSDGQGWGAGKFSGSCSWLFFQAAPASAPNFFFPSGLGSGYFFSSGSGSGYKGPKNGSGSWQLVKQNILFPAN